MAGLAASTALSCSDIPWEGPISEVRVAKIDGKYVVNPNRTELSRATLDIIVAATLKNLMMVEGEANECQEHELIEAIKVAHEAIKVQCRAQLTLADMLGESIAKKREIPVVEEDQELTDFLKTNAATQIKTIAESALEKHARKDGFDAILKSCVEMLTATKGEEYTTENKRKMN